MLFRRNYHLNFRLTVHLRYSQSQLTKIHREAIQLTLLSGDCTFILRSFISFLNFQRTTEDPEETQSRPWAHAAAFGYQKGETLIYENTIPQRLLNSLMGKREVRTRKR